MTTYWNIDRTSLNLLPISPKKTTEMQIICSGVDAGPVPQILDWGGGQLVQKRGPWRKGPFFK